MQTALDTLLHVVSAMPIYLVLLVLWALGRWIYLLTSPLNVGQEVVRADNPAVGLGLAGYLLGLGVALVGVVAGIAPAPDHTLATLYAQLEVITLLGLITIVLMQISAWVNDKFILTRFVVASEFGLRNSAVGWVAFGSFVANGFILNGALSGESETFWLGARDLCAYWLLGQVFLIVGANCFQIVTRYDDQAAIQDDKNVPAGILFASFLVALSVVIRMALAGSTSDVLDEMVVTSVTAIVGIMVLVAVVLIADKMLLHGSSLNQEIIRDRNPAVAAIVSAVMLGAAVLAGAAMNPNATDGQSVVTHQESSSPVLVGK